MGCSCCDMCERATVRDPHALMLASEKAGGRIGDLLPKIVGPADVANLKRDLDPTFLATDKAVDACPELDASQRAAWKGFFGSWVGYRDDWNSFLGFGSANRYDEGLAFQASLARWQDILREKCKVPGPPVVDPRTADEQSLAAIKVVGGVVVVVALVYGLKTVLK